MLEKVQSHINNFVNAAKEQRAAEEEAAEAEQEA